MYKRYFLLYSYFINNYFAFKARYYYKNSLSDFQQSVLLSCTPMNLKPILAGRHFVSKKKLYYCTNYKVQY